MAAEPAVLFQGASDEPEADAISTFLFVASDSMVTRSLSGHLLSVVVFCVSLTVPSTPLLSKGRRGNQHRWMRSCVENQQEEKKTVCEISLRRTTLLYPWLLHLQQRLHGGKMVFGCSASPENGVMEVME